MIKFAKLATDAVADFFKSITKGALCVTVSRKFCAKDRVVKTVKTIK